MSKLEARRNGSHMIAPAEVIFKEVLWNSYILYTGNNLVVDKWGMFNHLFIKELTNEEIYKCVLLLYIKYEDIDLVRYLTLRLALS